MKCRRPFRPSLLSLVSILSAALLGGCTYEYSLKLTKQWTKRMEFGDQYSVYRQRSIAVPSNVDVCVATALNQIPTGQRHTDELQRGQLEERSLEDWPFADGQQQAMQLSVSQQLLARQVNEALLPYVASVQLLGLPQSKTKALGSAYHRHCDFLLYPQIVLNQDKVSSIVELDLSDEEEFKIGFDHQWLQLALWDVNSGELADLSLIKSRNGFFTILAHHPDDLMPTTLAAYAAELFVVNSY